MSNVDLWEYYMHLRMIVWEALADDLEWSGNKVTTPIERYIQKHNVEIPETVTSTNLWGLHAASCEELDDLCMERTDRTARWELLDDMSWKILEQIDDRFRSVHLMFL